MLCLSKLCHRQIWDICTALSLSPVNVSYVKTSASEIKAKMGASTWLYSAWGKYQIAISWPNYLQIKYGPSWSLQSHLTSSKNKDRTISKLVFWFKKHGLCNVIVMVLIYLREIPACHGYHRHCRRSDFHEYKLFILSPIVLLTTQLI